MQPKLSFINYYEIKLSTQQSKYLCALIVNALNLFSILSLYLVFVTHKIIINPCFFTTTKQSANPPQPNQERLIHYTLTLVNLL